MPASLVAQLARGDRALRPGPECSRRSSFGNAARGARGRCPPRRSTGDDVVVTTYGTLQRVPWLCVARLERRRAGRGAGDQEPGRQADPSREGACGGRLRLALTGTPVENRLGDLWSTVRLRLPGLAGLYARRSVGSSKRLEKRGHGSYGPLRELVRPYILRRLKTDRRVIADLRTRPRSRVLRPHEEAGGAVPADVDDLERRCERRGRHQAARRRARVAHAPQADLQSPVALARRRRVCARGQRQVRAPARDRRGDRGRQEKVLVFTQFREMTEPLAEFLGRCFRTAGARAARRDAEVKNAQGLVAQFQEEDGPPVLRAFAQGRGHRAQSDRRVARRFTSTDGGTRRSRTRRRIAHTASARRRSVLVHKFVCRGTVEEKIDALIESKQDSGAPRSSTDGSEVKLTELDDERAACA